MCECQEFPCASETLGCRAWTPPGPFPPCLGFPCYGGFIFPTRNRFLYLAMRSPPLSKFTSSSSSQKGEVCLLFVCLFYRDRGEWHQFIVPLSHTFIGGSLCALWLGSNTQTWRVRVTLYPTELPSQGTKVCPFVPSLKSWVTLSIQCNQERTGEDGNSLEPTGNFIDGKREENAVAYADKSKAPMTFLQVGDQASCTQMLFSIL